MAFTINPDGSIRVDTADELRDVLRLRAQLERGQPVAQQHSADGANKKEPPRAEAARLFPPERQAAEYRAIYEQAADSPQQQRFLRVLLANPTWVSDAQLRHTLGLRDNVELRGLMIGIIRRATNRNVPSPFVKEMERTKGGKERNYRYLATPEFRRSMDGFDFGQEKIAV